MLAGHAVACSWIMLVFCAPCAGAAVVPRLSLRTPRTAGPARRGTVAMGFDSIIEPLNEWLVSAPYASAFCVTALKASSSTSRTARQAARSAGVHSPLSMAARAPPRA